MITYPYVSWRDCLEAGYGIEYGEGESALMAPPAAGEGVGPGADGGADDGTSIEPGAMQQELWIGYGVRGLGGLGVAPAVLYPTLVAGGAAAKEGWDYLYGQYGPAGEIEPPDMPPPPAPKVYEDPNNPGRAVMQEWNPSLLYEWNTDIQRATRSGFEQGSRMASQAASPDKEESNKMLILAAVGGVALLAMLR